MQRAIPIRVQHENTSELSILFFPTFCRARSNASNCTESVIDWRIVCDNATVFCLWNFAEKGFLLFLQAKCSFYYISSFIESLTKDTILCWKTHRCAWPKPTSLILNICFAPTMSQTITDIRINYIDCCRMRLLLKIKVLAGIKYCLKTVYIIPIIQSFAAPKTIPKVSMCKVKKRQPM